MVVNIYTFAETHIENILSNVDFIIKAFFLGNAFAEILGGYDELIEKYNVVFKRLSLLKPQLLKRVKAFFKPVKSLTCTDFKNIVFCEGNFTESSDEKKYLNHRGLSIDLFDNFYWLDKEDYLIKDCEQRELDWIDVLNDKLNGYSNTSAFIIGGGNHFRLESIINPCRIRKYLKLTDVTIHPCKLMKEPYTFFKKCMDDYVIPLSSKHKEIFNKYFKSY